MADWTKQFEASYSWWRVPRSSFDPYITGSEGVETERIPNITRATLQLNDSTETFETGRAQCVGMLDVGTDLIRCHMTATWADGTVEDVVLGTYDVSIPSRDVLGSYAECEAVLDGRLIELQQDAFETPLVVPKNVNGAAYASGIVQTRGLTFADYLNVGAATTSQRTYGLGVEGDGDGSVLSAYNDLMVNTQGTRAAKTDPWGRILVLEPIDYGSTPVWTFAEGEYATFLSEAVDERDTTGVCNVVACIYEDGESTVVGTAEDTDESSPWSIANYGRRKVAVYSYNGSATQAQADAKAARLLEENRSIVRRVTIKHTYCPARVGDIVEVSYPSAGIYGRFAIRTQAIEIGSGGCMTTSELRRFERA